MSALKDRIRQAGRSWRAITIAAIGLGIAMAPAMAQRSQRGQPKTPFSIDDFAKLHWLAGTWRATSPGASGFIAQYKFTNDSTIDITYRDSTNSRETGTGKLYLSVGRIYYTLGSGRWGASRADSTGVFLVPQINGHNTFAWDLHSPSFWSSTMRTGLGGHERITAFEMHRIAQ